MSANWDMENLPEILVEIKIVANDRVGLLANITRTITSTKTSIQSSSTVTKSNKKVYLTFTLQKYDFFKLQEIIEELQGIEGVIEVTEKIRISGD